jgi:exonuclease III
MSLILLISSFPFYHFSMHHTVLQWNCRSIRHKKSELIYLINKYKTDIIAVSETWLKPGSIFRISGYCCYRDDSSDGWGGSALFFKRSLPVFIIPLPSHSPGINIIAAKTMDISFISVYIPHPNLSLIAELGSILSQLSGPLLVMGDLNCHHTMWGSVRSDSLSPILLDSLDNCKLCLLNDGSPTRRTAPSQNPSAVDVTFSSTSLASRLIWKIVPYSHGSDHLPILITIPSRVSTPPVAAPPLLRHK